MSKIASLVNGALRPLNLHVGRRNLWESGLGDQGAARDLRFLQAVSQLDGGAGALHWLSKSKSQLRQDLFVLVESGFKTGGYFVEFGATNGFDLSNTYLLEKEFQWTGILAEPARTWHEALKSNRTATVESRCVWVRTGEKLEFREVAGAEYSTLSQFQSSDMHKNIRSAGRNYEVETVSLTDLLIEKGAPALIDYLSIDTEGSELDILEAHDFSKFKFRVITCEHNFTPARQKIFDLLARNGYVRILEEVSLFDDWYVLQDA
jgi:FkbM family methyltransferase